MFNRHTCLSSLFGVAAVVALGTSTAVGQNYPGKLIRIVTTSAGSGAEFASRLIAQAIAGPLGQPVIVDGRPVGVIPGQVVSQSPPDGYTLLYSSSSLWLGVLLRKSTPYDPLQDFQPITQTLRQTGLLVVHPALPVRSVKELVALAKARPGELNYASGSTGSLPHLAAELFQSMADVKVQRIDYKGGGPAITDLIAGRVQLMFGLTSLLSPHVKAGKLRALGVTSAQPTELAPGMLPLAASGLPGFQSLSLAGMFVPAKTPRAIVARLNQEIVRALFSPELKDRFLADGSEPVGGSPEQFEAVIKAEMETVAKLVKERGIRIDD